MSKNLFVSVDPIFFNGGAFHNDNVSIGLRSGVRDNAFFHVKASGENAVVGDPLLNQTGPAPSSYFGLAAGSPVSTYGAYPKGSVVWSVGPDTKDGAGATEGPAPDAVPGPLVNGTVYRLTSSLGSNRALDVASGGTNDGTRVQIWTANGSGAQSWRAIDQGDGTWTFEPGNAPGRALDVGRGNPQPADVQIWTQNRSAAQRWVLRNVPGGGVSLEPVSSPGLRLDVKDSGTSDGTNVQTWPANGTAAQTWFFTPVTR